LQLLPVLGTKLGVVALAIGISAVTTPSRDRSTDDGTSDISRVFTVVYIFV